MKLSDYVVSFLETKKIEKVFMVTGGGCMHLVNSFGNSKKIDYVCTHHEQGAAMAAEAYAKYKNDYAVVLTTSGPGATNTITGILDCWQDSIPVIFIFGQSKTKQTCQAADIEGLRQFGVQEANIIPIVQSITKYAVEINDPNSIKYHIEKALFLAKDGRPGPVVLSIPLDVQSAFINEKDIRGYEEVDSKVTTINHDDMQYIRTHLETAKRPVIIAGHGVRLAGACESLEQLVNKYNIPVVTPIMGIDVLPSDNECYIGRVGTKGTRAGNFAMQNADLIISIGSRLAVSVVGHEYDLFAREATVIVIDVDEKEHQKKTIEIDRLICADAKIAIVDILNNCNSVPDFHPWLEVCHNWKNKYSVVLEEYNNDEKGINYYKFIDILNNYMDAKNPVVSDAGSAFYVVAQAIHVKNGQRHITTGGTATMGFSVPASIGVSAASEDKAVIAITGEGSFMQNMQEMETIRYHNYNIKVFVMCNEGYFSIHQTQKKFFKGNYVGEGYNSGLSFTDIEKLAKAFDIKYYRLTSIDESERYIPSIINAVEPAIIEVKITPEMEIIPTNASKMKDNGVMVSSPLEDMYPFLNRQEFENNMIISVIGD